jgi:hypothetical protein
MLTESLLGLLLKNGRNQQYDLIDLSVPSIPYNRNSPHQ